MGETLREPKTAFQSLIRRLAQEAMSVTNHTTGEHEPEYVNEVRAMERRFAPLVRAHLAGRTRAKRRAISSASPELPDDHPMLGGTLSCG